MMYITYIFLACLASFLFGYAIGALANWERREQEEDTP